MTRSEIKSVDEYMASQPESVQGTLYSVRSTIRTTVPSAEELISYKIPTYELEGRPVLYFARWKRYYSLYPASDGGVAAFKKDLASYAVSWPLCS